MERVRVSKGAFGTLALGIVFDAHGFASLPREEKMEGVPLKSKAVVSCWSVKVHFLRLLAQGLNALVDEYTLAWFI